MPALPFCARENVVLRAPASRGSRSPGSPIDPGPCPSPRNVPQTDFSEMRGVQCVHVGFVLRSSTSRPTVTACPGPGADARAARAAHGAAASSWRRKRQVRAGSRRSLLGSPSTLVERPWRALLVYRHGRSVRRFEKESFSPFADSRARTRRSRPSGATPRFGSPSDRTGAAAARGRRGRRAPHQARESKPFGLRYFPAFGAFVCKVTDAVLVPLPLMAFEWKEGTKTSGAPPSSTRTSALTGAPVMILLPKARLYRSEPAPGIPSEGLFLSRVGPSLNRATELRRN